ncbi:MAG: hypothetical protein PF450_12795 [Bacteroidales bacterium]|jgi:uncharacterized protein with ATP-grasp and redox domains|nr:hypothetical protein [Bacteroidales bacterium]
MKTEYACIPCAVNSYLRLCETGVVPKESQEELLRKTLVLLSEVFYDIMDAIAQIMKAKLAVDDSGLLREALKNANTLMYIGDNCGEAVKKAAI